MNSQQPSNQSSMNPIWNEVSEKSMDYWEKMGKLNLWSGIMTAQKLQFENEAHQKNREAEESYVRKHVWGSEESSPDGDEVGNVYLGDVNNHPPTIIAPQQKTNHLLTAAALAAIFGAGGVAGYFLNRPQEAAPPISLPVSPEFNDESVNIGLGQYEDYFPQGG